MVGRKNLPWLLAAVLGVGAGAWPGRAAATVEEQRARLPPPAECQDPVEGIWSSHQFWETRNQWYMFTLEIHRASPGSSELTGTIQSDYWNGGPKDQQAPPCPTYHFLIHMPAKGSFRDGEVDFGGTSWTIEKSYCGGSPGRYFPDHFTGKIDPKIQEFQSVNNDGGYAVNVPTVFRRTRCFDSPDGAAPVPTISVTPPALAPKERGGCKCALAGGSAPGWPAQGAALGWLGASVLRTRRRRGAP